MTGFIDDYDFGISTVTPEEIPNPHFDKAERLYKAIMPLLNNLASDADKSDYIHWPGRKAKIAEFKLKLKNILET